ncbi:hypothetical protein [Cytobacillus horneckiae]|uniref:hypothetical protein n=1 Tax=Cytobacillus horneckiae TaxID=549687 RepID=UPI003D9A574E
MEFDRKIIQVIKNDRSMCSCIMQLYEEAPDDDELVMVDLIYLNENNSFKGGNYFEVLRDIRLYFEKLNIQVLCNGAALNVFPSPMQLSMGNGNLAYILKMGEPAKIHHVANIFEHNPAFEFVTVEKQLEYYHKWLKSLY